MTHRPDPGSQRLSLTRASVPMVIACIVIYSATSFILGDFYPFCRFHMFAEWSSSHSTIFVQTTNGQVQDPRDFEEWRCDVPMDLRPRAGVECANYISSPSVEARIGTYLRQHTAKVVKGDSGDSGDLGEEVSLIRRIHRFSDPYAAPEVIDCLLAECVALRRKDGG